MPKGISPPNPQSKMHIPEDVMLLVCKYLSSDANLQDTLQSFSLVSRMWHRVAVPRLYRNVKVKGPQHMNKFVRTLSLHPRRLQLIRTVYFDIRTIWTQDARSCAVAVLMLAKNLAGVYLNDLDEVPVPLGNSKTGLTFVLNSTRTYEDWGLVLQIAEGIGKSVSTLGCHGLDEITYDALCTASLTQRRATDYPHEVCATPEHKTLLDAFWQCFPNVTHLDISRSRCYSESAMTHLTHVKSVLDNDLDADLLCSFPDSVMSLTVCGASIPLTLDRITFPRDMDFQDDRQITLENVVIDDEDLFSSEFEEELYDYVGGGQLTVKLLIAQHCETEQKQIKEVLRKAIYDTGAFYRTTVL